MEEVKAVERSENDLSFNENSFIAASTQQDSSITFSETPPTGNPPTDALLTPIRSRRFTLNSSNKEAIPFSIFEDDHMSDETCIKALESACNGVGCSITSTNMPFLKCADCKMLVHYQCSKLPDYQVYMFVKKQRKYTCERCVTLPPDWVRSEVTETPGSDTPNTCGAKPASKSDYGAGETGSVEHGGLNGSSLTSVKLNERIEKLELCISEHIKATNNVSTYEATICDLKMALKDAEVANTLLEADKKVLIAEKKEAHAEKIVLEAFTQKLTDECDQEKKQLKDEHQKMKEQLLSEQQKLKEYIQMLEVKNKE